MNATWIKVGGLLRRRWGALVGVFLFLPAAEAVVYFALDPPGDRVWPAGIAATWLAVLFASIWLIEELLREEWHDGAIEIFAIAGASERFFWEWTLIGGALATLLTMAGWGVAALLYGLPLGASLGHLLALSAVYGWGTAGLTVLVRQLAHGAGAGGFLAPLLLFPLETPILLAGVHASRAAVLDGVWAGKWLLLGTFFGILYLLLGAWVVPAMLRE